jgi:hypothetical protein
MTEKDASVAGGYKGRIFTGHFLFSSGFRDEGKF